MNFELVFFRIKPGPPVTFYIFRARNPARFTYSALDSGALPALEELTLDEIPASVAAIDAVGKALAKSRAAALS